MFFCKLEPHQSRAFHLSRHNPASVALLTWLHLVKMPSLSANAQKQGQPSQCHLLHAAHLHLQSQCNLSTAPSSAPHLWWWSITARIARMWESPSALPSFLSLPLVSQEASKVVELRLGIISTLLSSVESGFPNHPCHPPVSAPPPTSPPNTYTHDLSISLKFVCLSVTWLLCTFHIKSFPCQRKTQIVIRHI